MSNTELKKIKGRVQNKHKTEEAWLLDVYPDGDITLEPRVDAFIPLDGELIIYDPDSVYTERRIKIGDGRTNVVALPFYQNNDTVYSRGLDYTLSDDGTYYSVTSIGTCEDTDIVIPKEYNGVQVTSIGDSAFQYCESLSSVVIPNSVTSIGDEAFSDCKSLTSVTIPDSVTTIGVDVFAVCSFLTIYCEVDSKPSRWHVGWNPTNCPVVWGFAGDFIAVNNKINAKVPQISITYSELKSLRDNGELKEGQSYRITDYVCTTSQENTAALNNQFDIIVTALDTHTLSETASITHHEGDTYFADVDLAAWEIKYSLDNDAERFAWADEVDGKGVIYYMKDHRNNEFGYDFTNITYKGSAINGYETFRLDPENYYSTFTYNRLMEYSQWGGTHEVSRNASLDKTIDGTIYYGYTCDTNPAAWGGPDFYVTDKKITNSSVMYFIADGGVSQINYGGNLKVRETLIISPLDGNIYSNIIHKAGLESFTTDYGTTYTLRYRLPLIVFIGNNCYSNTFGSNCYHNTFGNGCSDNMLGNRCYDNTFGSNCYNNIFGNECYYNTFSNGCCSNTFGNSCHHNIFDNYCCFNIFGELCYSNTFDEDCNYNTFGHECDYNIFGNSCSFNVFDPLSCDLNIIDETLCTRFENPDRIRKVAKQSSGFIYNTYTDVDGTVTYGINKIGSCIDKDIIIPELYKGDKVVSIDTQAFADQTTITSVILPQTLTSIKMLAFQNCYNLTKIFIPKSVSSISSTGVFSGCNNLTIYCEVESQPDSWPSDWNYSNHPVVWGYSENLSNVYEKVATLNYNSANEGDFLRIVNGIPTWASMPNAEDNSF